VDLPLRRPTAGARRALAWAQALAAAAVLACGVGLGSAVQERLDARPPAPVDVLVEVPGAGAVSTGPSESDGALAGIGAVIVGWTLVASAGTVARRRLDDRDSERWEREWAAVEPEWSGRVS
jgi:hypothetical protein